MAQHFVALLRGINVGGHKKVPMAELRDLASGLGLTEVQTYIQSGNLICGAAEDGPTLEDRLEAAIGARFGFPVSVIVRTAVRWRAYAEASPFPDARTERPKLLHLGLCKRPPLATAADTLSAYARAGERIALANDALWIDFAEGLARSKLTPKRLDAACGSTVTARNWRSVLAIAERLPPA